MEIQDLTNQHLFRRPLDLVERPSPLLAEDSQDSSESDIFQPVEGAVEINVSGEVGDDPEAEADALLDQILPFGIEANPNGSLPLQGLKHAFEEKSAELSNRLRLFFSSQCIQAPVAADMAVDSQGRVVVSNAGEQQAALEAEFEKDEALNTKFNELSASAPLLRAADTSADFANVYERNPQVALEEFPHLFSNNFKFNFHFENDRLNAEFKSATGQAIGWREQ